MKSRFGFLAALLFALLAGGAAAQRPQIALDVRKKQDTDTEQTATRSTLTKEQDRTIALTIQLRNNDATDQTFKLSWYYIGNPLASDMDNFVYEKGEQTMTLAARTGTNFTQVSRAVSSKIYSSKRKSTKEGARPLGYIVTVSQDTNLIAIAASPLGYERVARDPAAMAELLAAPTALEP